MKHTCLEVKSAVLVSKIFLIRDKKITLDKDLAELYGVSKKALNPVYALDNLLRS